MELNNIKYMIEGIYKKLKTYYYYDKTLLYIKRQIIEFESSDKFEEIITTLTEKIYKKDMEYFNELINQIDFVVLPKSFINVENNDNIIRGSVDKNKKISKVNFSIKAPVEILLLDMLWGIFIKKIYFTMYGEFNNSYAGIFKKGVFKTDNDLISGIEFESNRCFEPYYKCYSKWRNNALDTVKEKCQDENIVMLSMDLKSFYYSVEFDFEELESIFSSDKRYQSIDFYTKVVKNVYKKYTNLVGEYKHGIEKCKDKYVLPIGLISPMVIREIILSSVDKDIVEKLHPFYYGRYVDDMLLVMKINRLDKNTSEMVIDSMLQKNGIIRKCNNDNEYEFTKRKSLKLQNEKINCFLFERGNDNVLIDVYYKQILKNSSEANLLPDVDVLNESFNNNAYATSFSDNTGKIRNLEFLESNNYKATIFIEGLKRYLKNTTYDSKNIDKYLNDIMKFYSGSQAIEFSNTWRTIFELMVLCHDKKRANKFYSIIKKEIQNISLDFICESEVLSEKKKVILGKLQSSLIQKLDVALSLAISLDLNSGKQIQHKELAKKIRYSNMLNHNMVSFPLINYSTDESIENIALINMSLGDVLSDLSLRKKLFRLDSRKLQWTPRFIHLGELYYCTFFFYVGSNSSLVRKDYSDIFSKYTKYNSLSDRLISPIFAKEEPKKNENNIICNKLQILNYTNERNNKFGLVNAKIKEQDVLEVLLHPEKGMTIEKKRKLYEILNIAKKEKVEYLVFPEFYMPSLWLSDIDKFLKMNGITLITGLQYINCEDRVYNIVAVIGNACGKYGFKNTIPLFREKNFYAPDEKLELAALNFVCEDPKEKNYYIIDNCYEKFSTILCFEFTDIFSRAIMKGNIDFLCVPQLNRDTNYFSSIVESASRDLHAIIIQANTSIYGDSRITGPYKTDYKDVLKIKGGENETIIVGKINLLELQNYRENYQKEYDAQLEKCRKCKKVKSINQFEKCCKKCKRRHKSIKGLPPNWKL